MIEPAMQADIGSVLKLLTQCCLPTEGLVEHVDTCLIARSETGVVGSVALEMYGTSALLRSLVVDPGKRGCGLGKALTAAALDLATRRGVAEVYLLTETAPRFFSRLGFQPIERANVPEPVTRSVEFISVCPLSAQAMVKLVGMG
jgi:amino-acid N-acetyltransferase